MARDDFNKDTILNLQIRVNGRCANPKCRVPTSGPRLLDNKAMSIGVAAHICAASKGGPRYNPLMSSEQRKSQDNGIWLCSNCASKIDRDINKFSVELLKQWKIEAELSASKEIGNKLPHPEDARDTLVSAMTGNLKRFIPDAISNIHKASSESLEALDPRFKISTSYNNGCSNISIHAKEDVSLKMLVQGDNVDDLDKKFTNLRELGESFEISTKDIAFEGSKLFEEFLSNAQAGRLKISAPKRLATFKLWMKSINNDEVEYFEDVIGDVTVGSKDVKFNGVACKKIFEFSFGGIAPGVKKFGNSTMTLNLNQWSGFDVRRLPYFSKIFSFFEKLAAGWSLNAALEIDGINVLTCNAIDFGDMKFIYQQNSFLQYTKSAQTIASYLDSAIRFNSEVEYSLEEYIEVIEAARVIEGKAIYDAKDFKGEIGCDLLVDDALENLRLLESCSDPLVVKITQGQRSKLKVFELLIEMPPQTMIFNAVLPRIISLKEKFKLGDNVTLKMIPTENFQMIKYFQPSP